MVMVGAASPFLPLEAEILEATIDGQFAAADPAIAGANRRAFSLGRNAAVSGETRNG
jgi:indolepyruvate ferredoxin oxidoreductase beta subunit